MTFDESRDLPMVSPVIGEGDDAHRVVRVGDYAFTAWTSDEEPRMRDAELAEKLRYAQPRDIRKLISRLEKEGKMPGICVRATVARSQTPTGGTREVTVKEYWLTEAEVLYIAAKSETAEADTLLREVIRVYMLARKGLLPSGDVSGILHAIEARFARQDAAILQQSQALTSLVTVVSQLGEMMRTVFDDHSALRRSVAGKAGARWISRQLKLYGSLMGDGSKASAHSWRGRGETELRGALGFSGAGRAWHDLPTDDLARAQVKLAEMNGMAKKIAVRKQLDLPTPPAV